MNRLAVRVKDTIAGGTHLPPALIQMGSDIFGQPMEITQKKQFSKLSANI